MALLRPCPRTDHLGIVQIDSLALVLVTAGILLAIAAAILVGTLTARLFFHASRGDIEEVTERRHEVSR